MKKLFAIFLLSVYLFNLAGYSLLFQHFIIKSDSEFVKQLDNNHYSEKDLLEVKVPLHMPYIINTNGYERTDGELEHNGVHYNYVKRKVSNDTLYVLCLPNISKTQLYKAKTTYSKEVNDIPSNKKAADNNKKAGFDTEYNHSFNLHAATHLCDASAGRHQPIAADRLLTIFLPIPEQPPKVAC